MSGFRIGAPALPAKDVAYIRALVRLFAYTEKIAWTYVDKAPYTALVAPSDAAPGRDPVSLVLIMLDKVHEPHTISYPIRADQLRDWLKRMAQSLLAHAGAAAPAKPAVQTDVQAEVQTEPQAAGQPAPGARPAAPPLPAHAAQAAMEPHTRYKLRRWPSPALLGGEQLRIQMATCMSRRHVNAAELAGLAGATPDQARAFMDALHQAGLLMGPPPGPSGLPEPAPSQLQAAPAPAVIEVPRTGFGIAGITSSLLDNIRRRMGKQGTP